MRFNEVTGANEFTKEDITVHEYKGLTFIKTVSSYDNGDISSVSYMVNCIFAQTEKEIKAVIDDLLVNA